MIHKFSIRAAVTLLLTTLFCSTSWAMPVGQFTLTNGSDTQVVIDIGAPFTLTPTGSPPVVLQSIRIVGGTIQGKAIVAKPIAQFVDASATSVSGLGFHPTTQGLTRLLGAPAATTYRVILNATSAQLTNGNPLEIVGSIAGGTLGSVPLLG